MNRETPLYDQDPMPFGRHKDKPLIDVPMSYWRWFKMETWCAEWPAVHTYATLRLQGKNTAKPKS